VTILEPNDFIISLLSFQDRQSGRCILLFSLRLGSSLSNFSVDLEEFSSAF